MQPRNLDRLLERRVLKDGLVEVDRPENDLVDVVRVELLLGVSEKFNSLLVHLLVFVPLQLLQAQILVGENLLVVLHLGLLGLLIKIDLLDIGLARVAREVKLVVRPVLAAVRGRLLEQVVHETRFWELFVVDLLVRLLVHRRLNLHRIFHLLLNPPFPPHI